MNRNKLALVMTLLFIGLGAAWRARYKMVELITDNKRHGLPCGRLPTLAEVDKTVLAHRETVDQIIRQVGRRYKQQEVTPYWNLAGRSVADGDPRKGVRVVFEWGLAEGCSEGAEVNLRYPAHADRRIFETTVGGTFFGVPYNLTNW